MGKKKKKQRRKDPSGPKGAPDWVVTFTDMISLLVTFFVLLMTFSSMEANEVLLVDSFLSGNTGVNQGKGFTQIDPPDSDQLSSTSIQRGSMQPHSRPPDELPESIEDMGRERSEDRKEIDFSNVSDGLLIEFGDEDTFDPGSVRINAVLRESLIEVARVLEHYPHLVVVEGFTDGAFKPTPRYHSEDALSLARAHAASEVMLANSNMTPELLQIAGLGSELPRADNVSPGGRRLNRRVRLRVLSLSKARATHLEAAQEAENAE